MPHLPPTQAVLSVALLLLHAHVVSASHAAQLLISCLQALASCPTSPCPSLSGGRSRGRVGLGPAAAIGAGAGDAQLGGTAGAPGATQCQRSSAGGCGSCHCCSGSGGSNVTGLG